LGMVTCPLLVIEQVMEASPARHKQVLLCDTG
jgi:hypothetical protein